MMPDEGRPHARTWMAFGASERIWGKKLLSEVQRDLAAIATTIARFEPVTMLVRPAERDLAARLVGGSKVELVSAELDDLWIRDSGPVFVNGSGGRAAVDFNFNGWGEKQEHRSDAKISHYLLARALEKQGSPRRISRWSTPRMRTWPRPLPLPM